MSREYRADEDEIRKLQRTIKNNRNDIIDGHKSTKRSVESKLGSVLSEYGSCSSISRTVREIQALLRDAEYDVRKLERDSDDILDGLDFTIKSTRETQNEIESIIRGTQFKSIKSMDAPSSGLNMSIKNIKSNFSSDLISDFLVNSMTGDTSIEISTDSVKTFSLIEQSTNKLPQINSAEEAREYLAVENREWAFEHKYAHIKNQEDAKAEIAKEQAEKLRKEKIQEYLTYEEYTEPKTEAFFDKALDVTQTVLDIVGLIPGIGEIADGINAVVYLAQGDLVNAGLSTAAMIPFGGWGATGTKLINKVFRYGDEAADIGKAILKNGDEAADVAKSFSKHIDETTDIVSNEITDGVSQISKEKVTYRRVQGGTGNKSSQDRVLIDNSGNVYISNKNAKLNISIDNGEHAKYYIENRRPNADIYEFDVPKWLDDMVREYTIPQEGYKNNPFNQGKTAPSLNDVSTPGTCIEFPAPWIEWIEEYAGNGIIIKGEY